MSSGRSLLRLWVPLALAFFVGSMSVGVAVGKGQKIKGNLKVTKSVKAKGFQFSAPQTNTLVLGAGAFHVGGDNAAEFLNHDFETSVVKIDDGTAAVAGVSLPNGAIVTQLEVHLANPSDPLLVELESSDTNAMQVPIASTNVGCSTGSSCTASDTTISPNVIDNATRHYGVSANCPSTFFCTLYKVVIQYTTTSVGPASG